MRSILFGILGFFMISLSLGGINQSLIATTHAKSIPVSNGGILPGPNNTATSKEAGVSNYIKNKFLPAITNWILVILTLCAVIVVIVGGLTYIVSGGESEMYNKGRDTVVWAIIGVVVAILSYAIVKFIIGINFF